MQENSNEPDIDWIESSIKQIKSLSES